MPKWLNNTSAGANDQQMLTLPSMNFANMPGTNDSNGNFNKGNANSKGFNSKSQHTPHARSLAPLPPRLMRSNSTLTTCHVD